MEHWATTVAKRAKAAPQKLGRCLVIPVARIDGCHYSVQFQWADVQDKTIPELAAIAENQMRNVDMEG